ncbi:MAG: exodeoxyribonuclease VII large subunit [Candidatus Cloacimonadales bacterium]|nr:exodeoxyribonuclease VII large subunit [Candidatus Cloacimonadales bacterium]
MPDIDNIFTVSEVSKHIRNVIESNIPNLFVEGEIANFTKHSSGHIYFSLKDEKSSLRCVFFKTYALYLTFKPKDGDKVICGGKISVYEKSGNYQLSVTRMIQSGIGDLQRRFEELKNKLEEEGLFDPEHKKPLPEFPESIGVVTSATGAAIQDIQNVLNRRFPVKIYLYPAVVQGDVAPGYIIKGIKYFNEEFPVDVLIIGRGGGSQEDLFCFNDEELARTIFASKIPIISAVGHEIDFTISDFVADLRAPTPSAAAELAVPDRNELLDQIEGLKSTLQYAAKQFFFSKKMEISELQNALNAHHPQAILQNMKQRLNQAVLKLSHVTDLRVKDFRIRLEILQNELKELSPQEALKRGYAFIRQERKLIHSVKEIKLKDTLEVLLSDGKLEAEVILIEENNE